ncbi:MAG TPA: hypothetical protein VK157_00660 [Phycisphaerales bacterium]|nr:hypothetical protein [Phycisphaerales bacterium]
MMRTRMMMAAAGLACVSGMAMGQLQNANFETLDNTGLFWPSWTYFNNVLVETGAAQSGVLSARLGGNFTGPFNVSGIFQSIPASAQQVIEASAWFQNPAGDPLQGDNFVVLNIEFYNAANQMIAVKEMRAADVNTPTGVWRQVTNTATAPCDTASARIVPLFVQGAQLAGGSILVDTAAMAPNGTDNTFTVQNPGFEVEGYIPGWVTFGNAFREWQFTHTGGGAIKFFGNFNTANNVSGAFQVFCVEPGLTYTASAWAGTPGNDAIRGGDFAVLNLEVFDSAGAPINAYPDPNNPANSVNYTTVQAVAPTATPGVYTQVSNTTVMPVNAAKVRLVLLHVQPDPAQGGGSTWFDDITFAEAAPAGCDTIDFNGNGVFPEDQDVIDFFNVLAGADCPTGTCADIDFNNNGVFPEDQDVVDFFNVLAGGECP